MGENRRKSDKAGLVVDPGRLHDRDLMRTKALAHDLEPAGERGIAEGAVTLAWKWRADGGCKRLLWVGELGLRLGEGGGDRANRVTGAVHGWPPSRSGRSAGRS